MLPILSEFEFSHIIPLSESSTHRIEILEGINVLHAENGYGKTTLLDIIERSICSDAHAQRYFSFARKRVDKKAYIKSKWISEKEISIYQSLTDAGIRTRVTERGKGQKTLSKEEYSDYMYREFCLTLFDFQDLFQSLYYKREDDHSMLGRQEEADLLSFFELINRFTSGAPEDYLLRQKIRTRENERKNILDQIRKLEETEDNIRNAMKLLGIGEVDEKLVFAKLKAFENERKSKEELIQGEDKYIQELEKDEEKKNKILSDIREENYEIRVNLDRLKSRRREYVIQREMLIKTSKIATKIGNEKYDYLRTKVRNDSLCEFCHTNLEKVWDARINIGCPLCGTDWSKLPSSLREGLFSIEAQDEPKTEALEGERTKVDNLLFEINQEITNIEEEELRIAKQKEEKLHDELSEIRLGLKNHNQNIRRILEEIKESDKKSSGIEIQMEILTKNVNLNAVQVNKRKILIKLEKIQEEIANIKKQESTINERAQIIKQFSETTTQIFGYGMTVDPRTLTISLMFDGSTRAYDSMSGGEKYFVDLCLRIAVWKYLLAKGFTSQALMLVDSPENALDSTRLKLLADVINNEKKDFVFIITTRNEEFSNLLKGEQMKVRKEVQTSLFDFIEQNE